MSCSANRHFWPGQFLTVLSFLFADQLSILSGLVHWNPLKCMGFHALVVFTAWGFLSIFFTNTSRLYYMFSFFSFSDRKFFGSSGSILQIMYVNLHISVRLYMFDIDSSVSSFPATTRLSHTSHIHRSTDMYVHNCKRKNGLLQHRLPQLWHHLILLPVMFTVQAILFVFVLPRITFMHYKVLQQFGCIHFHEIIFLFNSCIVFCETLLLACYKKGLKVELIFLFLFIEFFSSMKINYVLNNSTSSFVLRYSLNLPTPVKLFHFR